jgi:hypothetical protein
VKPVKHKERKNRVVKAIECQSQTESGRAQGAEWNQVVTAIDERAHYVGPVLEGLLQIKADKASPWDQR